MPLSAKEVLQQYWSFSSFRPLQEEIITAVLQGKDVFTILPTGGGKSLCYQLPALMMPGTALVISPLIALMNDQVKGLTAKGIPSAAIHSGLSNAEKAEIEEDLLLGAYKIIYSSPERLHSEHFRSLAKQVKWSILIIDEAHCISEWGHDFRPLYREIHSFKEEIQFKNTIALTASATNKVKADIVAQLQLRDPVLFQQSVFRQNLKYSVVQADYKLNVIQAEMENATQIIYCPTRKKTEDIAFQLNQQKHQVLAFHAGLPHKQKKEIQEYWTQSNHVSMAATNAFGMGIDKPNVRKVMHYMPPYSLEAYYQEAGRAGRDGQEAAAILIYNQADILHLKEDIELRFPPIPMIKKVYQAVCDYLQVSLYEGQDNLYFISISEIVQHFKIPLFTLLHAIKIIEQNQYWIWENDDKTFDKIKFKVSRRELEELQLYFPELYDFSIQILRLYGGVFYYDTKVDLMTIAQFTKMNYGEVQKRLFSLDSRGVLKYQAAKSGSSLYFLENRIQSNQLNIDQKRLAFLKQRHTERIHAMIDYLEDQHTCRNVILGQYFGEEAVKDCGFCDHCLKKGITYDIQELETAIIQYLKQKKTVSLSELYTQFIQMPPEWIQKTIQKGSLEGMFKIQGMNIIFAS